MGEYTVAGLIKQDGGELFVSGVFEGALVCADTDPLPQEEQCYGLQRWASRVQAEDAEQAERAARQVHLFGGPVVDMVASMVEVGDSLVYDDGTSDKVEDVSQRSGGDIVLHLDSDSDAVEDPSAVLRVVRP